MVNYSELRKNFIKVLNVNKVDTNYKYIDGNSNFDKPKYPFATVNFTTPYSSDYGVRGIESHGFNAVTDKLEFKRMEQPTAIISITTFSNNKDEAFQMAMDTMNNLKFLNVEDFEISGIIIIETTNVSDRTSALEEIMQEYKQGFDVTIRYISELIKEIDYIKEVETKKGV